MAATWPLWWPDGAFPLAPLPPNGLSRFLQHTPLWVDQSLSFGLAFSLAAVIVGVCRPRLLKTRYAWLVAIACAVFLIGLNQHRLQAWIWQLLLFGLLFANCPASTAWRWAQWLVASIYVHSALGKFDHSFLHTLGVQFGEVIFQWLPIESPSNLPTWAVAFPAGELAAGLLLLAPGRWKRGGVVIAVGMHLSLLLILGPLGLNHHLAVLLWNVFFLIVTPTLFLEPELKRSGESGPPRNSPMLHVWTCGLVAAALMLPFVERAGIWDHWPSWGLYSPAAPRVLMWIAAEEADQLPAEIRTHLAPSRDDPTWQRLSLAQLSLAATRSPIYPQDRFHAAVAIEIARRHGLQRNCRFAFQGFPNRWTGERVTEYMNYEQALRRVRRFRMNGTARTFATK